MKNEYTSQPETNGTPKKMVDLGSRKFEGIGPTTRDGMPIVLRSVCMSFVKITIVPRRSSTNFIKFSLSLCTSASKQYVARKSRCEKPFFLL